MAETDLISRQAAIDAIENIDWYHQNSNKYMVRGASNEHEAWYKADDVYNALESVPSAQPGQLTDKEQMNTIQRNTRRLVSDVSWYGLIESMTPILRRMEYGRYRNEIHRPY